MGVLESLKTCIFSTTREGGDAKSDARLVGASGGEAGLDFVTANWWRLTPAQKQQMVDLVAQAALQES